MTTTTFRTLSLVEPILDAVAASGYDSPTEIQTLAIPHLLAGRDVLATAQTGTGKTAAFVLPMLQLLADRVGDEPRDTRVPSPIPQRGGRSRGRRGAQQIRRPARANGPATPMALILAPTRELAIQIDESITEYGRNSPIRHMAIYGGASRNRQIDQLGDHPHVVTATPGRLLDLLGEGYLTLQRIEYFVLDEGDRMMDMGFIPDVRRIIAKIESTPQAAVFSATMPKEIEQLAGTILRDPIRVAAEAGEMRIDRIDHSVLFVDQANKLELLVDLIRDRQMYKAIVFTRTKHRASKVAKILGKEGIDSDAIHGNKSQNARQRTIGAFKGGSLQVLVATDIASRGLDIDDVTHVVNFEIPNEPETYVHRVGRTARAGAGGVALSLCDTTEIGFLRDIERLMDSPVEVDREHRFHVEPAQRPRPNNGGGKPGGRPSSGRPSEGRRDGGRSNGTANSGGRGPNRSSSSSTGSAGYGRGGRSSGSSAPQKKGRSSRSSGRR